jgi:hypothetical protein
MCLTLRSRHSDKPYNRSTIRWKIANVGRCGGLTSQYKSAPISRTKVNKARTKGLEAKHAGIHVYVTRAAAIVQCWCHDKAVLKVRVKGFLASGTFSRATVDRIDKSETWREYRVLSVTKLGD